MNKLLARSSHLLSLLLAFGLPGAAFAQDDEDPPQDVGLVRNGPLLKTAPALPSTLDFDASPAPAPLALPSYFEVAAGSGQYAKISTVVGDMFIEFLTEDAPLTVANFKSYLATNTTSADDKSKTYDGTFFHRAAENRDFFGQYLGEFVVQGGGYRSEPGLPSLTKKPQVVNEFKAANTRGTLAMAKKGGQPNSADSEWFINIVDNRETLGTDNNGGFTVFARILGTGMTVADKIAALPTFSLNLGAQQFEDLPLRDVKPGQTQLLLTNLITVKTIREVPATAVPAAIRNIPVQFTLLSNSNPAALTATLAKTGSLTLRPTTRGGRSELTFRAAVPSGHHTDHVIVTTRVGPPVVVTPPPSTVTAALGTTARLRADVTAWPIAIKWQRRANASAEWVDLVNAQPAVIGTGTEQNPEFPAIDTPYAGVTTQDLEISLPGNTTEKAGASLALDGSQFRYVVSNTIGETNHLLEGAPITLDVTTTLAVAAPLAVKTTAALGSNFSLSVSAASGTLPSPAFQWQRKAAGSTEWSDLTDAKAAVVGNGTAQNPQFPAVLSPYSGAKTGTLTVRLTGSAADSGTGLTAAQTLALEGSQFRCKLTHDRGAGPVSVESTATTLDITTLPVGFSAQPSKLFTGQLGGSASVSVTSLPAVSNTPIIYQWQRLPAGQNPKIATNWVNLANSTAEAPTRYTGVNTRTLTISFTDTEDAAKVAALALNDDQYRCLISNILGSDTSTAASLRVITEDFNYVTLEDHLLPGLAGFTDHQFSASGLPKGLALGATGHLSGTPTAKPGLYKVTITIRQSGAIVGTRTYYIDVRALSGNNAGGFESLLSPSGDEAPPVAKFAILVASTGGYTGTLVTTEEKTPLAFKGAVQRSPDGVLSLPAPIVITRPGTPAGRTYVISDFAVSAGGVLAAKLSTRAAPSEELVEIGATSGGVHLGAYSKTNNAPWAQMGVFNLAFTKPAALSEAPPPAPIPAGSGWARAPINAAGQLTITGKLPDGAPLTASVATGVDASYRLFARPYGVANGAFVSSDFKLVATSVFNPRLGKNFPRYALAAGAGEDSYWRRPADIVKPAGYTDGFGPLGLTLQVHPWIFFNGTNLGISFSGANNEIGTLGAVFNGPLLEAAGLPTSLRLDFDKLTFADATPPDARQLSIKLNEANGTLTGSLVLADGRKVTLEGIFLVPTNVNNSTLANGTITAEGFATIPAPAGAPASPTTERFRLHQAGAVPAP